jgi:xanthine dehydrogenase YagR molybdenum-binding subunit
MSTTERTMSTTERVTGSPIVRIDGQAKVTGAATYAYEYPLEDMAYAWPVQATIAKGRVASIDDSAALDRPDVLAVLTPENAPRLRPDAEVPLPFNPIPDLFILQSGDVAFRGQIVAAVIATSLESAREGAGAVRVTYEQEPHDVTLRFDDDRAYVPDAVNGDLSPGNVERGDADGAFADAPVRIDQMYTTPAEQAVPMEPHAATAVWDGDRLTIYNSDQGPFFSALPISALFGLEPGAVEIVAEYVGGGFGSKGAPRPPTMLAALAAKLVDRPVKVALNRRQSFSLTTYRTPTIQRLRLGAERDGRLAAIVHESVQQSSKLIEYTEQSVSSTRALYAAPDVRTTARVSRLDVPTPGWFRAPGHAPGMYALESAIDELAVELEMDPIELRVLNEPDADPETGQPFSSRNLVGALREGAARFGWDGRDPRPAVRREGRWLVGTGVAAAHLPVYTFPSTARARAEADGGFVVSVGATDIGTGARTVLTQVAADALEVTLDRVRLEIGRASMGSAPFAAGSSGTASWGWAVEKACGALLEEIRANDGIVPPDGIEVQADTTEDVGALAEMSRNGYGAQFAELRVDIDTGQIRVDRMLGVFAIGRILNPRTARSQIVGAMTMGLSMALMEIAEPDREFGGFANHDLAGYHVAAHADVRDVDCVFLDEDDKNLNSIAGKGVGEMGIVGAAAAVANALHHATGLRVRDLPIRIEDVRPSLKGLRAR